MNKSTSLICWNRAQSLINISLLNEIDACSTFFVLKIALRYIDIERKSAMIGGMHSMAKL